MTYRELLQYGRARLRTAVPDEADGEARLLLQGVAGFGSGGYLLHSADEVPEEILDRYEVLLAERLGGRPLAYVLGEWEFCGLPFRVDERVLIPRPETELLVQAAEELAGEGPLLDLCTGSGCVAVALALRTGLPVWAADLSADALEVARENALSNGADVRFLQGDLFGALPADAPLFSLIASNPPYVRREEYVTLQPEITRFEPELAFVAEEEGLAFYRRLAEEAASHLLPGGALCCEIGEDQGEAVCRLLREHGWQDVRLLRDLAGLDRTVTARRP